MRDRRRLTLGAAWLLLAVTLAYLGGCAIANRNPPLPRLDVAENGRSLPPVGEALTVTVWNVGYAGLGRESDFVADGGRMLRPPSKAATEANLAAITAFLAAEPADIVLLQEAARPGLLTRGIDVLGGIETALEGRWRAFSPDIATRFTPRPLAIRQGLAAFARGAPASIVLHPLPEDGSKIAGLVTRRYHVQALRLDGAEGAPDWTVINLHLSAFDEGGHARRAQVEALMAFASEEAAAGRLVVMGGDWNMRLNDAAFPHATEERHLFWVHDFPSDLLPAGFTVAADPRAPTVRTNHQPYEPGVNYTTVIDGFITGPGVTAEVETVDLGFANSDHNPVRGVFRPAP
jgi:endonuclease/exonuclease/phosphatase family metal-dependent hydrolase